MDSTLWGVIIGSLISLIGNVINNRFLLRKQKEQWKNEQKVEQEKRLFETEKISKENKITAYHNCIKTLSLLMTDEFNPGIFNISDERQLELYQEAHKYLSSIAIFHMDKQDEENVQKFFTEFKYFSEFKDATIIRRLRDLVLSLLMTDKELFPNFPDINEKETYDICISIKFDEEFRREQFLDGIDIPQNYSFKIKIDELTTKQRMLLWDLYYDSYHELPKRLEGLSLPTYDEKNKKINLGGKSWAARINPYVSERKEIMNAWQTDYENAYQEVISLGEVNNDE